MSRTAKSIKNSCVALVMYFINLILQFFTRKIFLNYLGSEILGLNTTVTNLLQFLNLAELGIGVAIGFTLYKPLYNNDKESIKEILTLQGWYYKRIAFLLIIGSCILMFFFPFIFKKIQLPLWYAYASYIVMLFGSLLSYFFNFKQILLSADQKDYKIQYSYRLVILIKLLVEAIVIKFTNNPFFMWLVLETIFSIIATVSLSRTINRTYPFLNNSTIKIGELKQKHRDLIIKIGQVFYHKIGGFALTQSSPLIIYAYANLAVVTLYSNYIILTTALTSLLGAIFNSMGGGIGNLVAADNKTRTISVFYELFSLRFIIITSLCVGFWILSPSIVSFWIGESYLLPDATVLIIICTMFITANRSTVDNFLSAYGLYGDIYAPLVEAVLNIALSILLGYYWGLNGILLGVLISLIVVIFCWKPYYLFRMGFKIKFKMYIMQLLKNMVSFIGAILVVFMISRTYTFPISNNSLEFLKLFLYVCCYGASCIIIQVLLGTGICAFIKRISLKKRLFNNSKI